MPDINDIWSDDEFNDLEREKMDPRERRLAEMAANQRRREAEQRAKE